MDSKAEKNLRKHGVRFTDAVGVFLDPRGVGFSMHGGPTSEW